MSVDSLVLTRPNPSLDVIYYNSLVSGFSSLTAVRQGARAPTDTFASGSDSGGRERLLL